MHNFRELNIWKESMTLAKSIFTLTKSFPETEKYGLTSQMNRCSVSIPSNIAEGTGRDSDKELKRFLNIALGSCFELETQILLAKSFEYIDLDKSTNLVNEITTIQKMISGFKRSL